MKDSLTVPRDDQVQLELPASPEYGPVARTAAAQLALRRGFSLDEINDLTLVIDEAAVMLLNPGLAVERIELRYSMQDDTVRVKVRALPSEGIPITADRIARFSELVGELVDEYTIDAPGRLLTLSKTRGFG